MDGEGDTSSRTHLESRGQLPRWRPWYGWAIAAVVALGGIGVVWHRIDQPNPRINVRGSRFSVTLHLGPNPGCSGPPNATIASVPPDEVSQVWQLRAGGETWLPAGDPQTADGTRDARWPSGTTPVRGTLVIGGTDIFVAEGHNLQMSPPMACIGS